MNFARTSLAAGLVLALGGFGGVVLHKSRDRFDHEKHRKVFPECAGCHAGVTDPARPVFPPPDACAACHDGVVKPEVKWSAPAAHPSNLRFTHAAHLRKSGAKLPPDSTLACQECHIPSGAAWMTVRRALPDQCLRCHGIRAPHFSAPDTACGTCHVTLVEAVALPAQRVAAFGKPATHDDVRFPTAEGHGELAERGNRSCAVCHARDFCTQCHVNAPEIKAIQALAPDSRSLAIQAELKAPVSHQEPTFLSGHGGSAKRDAARCAFCHTRESCMACHRTRPEIVLALPNSSPGRGLGAQIVLRPGYHPAGFADRHAPQARSAPAKCSACHARAECLECHRPNPGADGNYHPAGFLTRHPSAAFNRQTDCAVCHNQGAVCTTCHEQSGMVSTGRLQRGYHDANGAFALNHGGAARQNIESCVSCHSERDCLTCHSALGGRSFNPHGPGFDPDRLRQRNPQMCAACHGKNIPGN
jgi:doubled CXXCH motif protein